MEALNICISNIFACPKFFFEFQNIQSFGALSSRVYSYESISSDVDQATLGSRSGEYALANSFFVVGVSIFSL